MGNFNNPKSISITNDNNFKMFVIDQCPEYYEEINLIDTSEINFHPNFGWNHKLNFQN